MKEKFNKSGNKGRGRHSPTKNMSRYKLVRRHPHRYSSVDISPSSTTTISSTGSQTYTVGKGVDKLNIVMYGGGGGGGEASEGTSRGNPVSEGGGGGGGSKLVIILDEVPSGTVLTFNVGAGGAKGSGNACGADGGNTTLSYGGKDFVAGGGEGNSSGHAIPVCADDGSGGVADCDSFGDCTGTNGNNGTAKHNNSTQVGGAALGDSAGAGGRGSGDNASQLNEAGDDGKVIIS